MDNIDEDPKRETLAELYARLVEDRYPFLDRARQCSDLTLPTLIPPEGHNSTTVYRTPWQSIGSRGVNNLASRMLMSLFPPNSPIFRMQVDDDTLVKLGANPEAKAKVEEGLSKIERSASRKSEQSGHRSVLFMAIKHMLVSGNALLVFQDNYKLRMFPLGSYVILRDFEGSVIDVVTEELVSEDTLDPKVKELLEKSEHEHLLDSDKPGGDQNRQAKPKDEVYVYTRYFRDGNRIKTYQEIDGFHIDGSEGSWPVEKSPVIPLRWTPVDGENYGRGYVEEYLGDLVSLEGLSQSIVEASAAAARVVWTISPNGVTRERDFAQAESGDVITGNPDDIGCVQTNKHADLRITYEAAKTLTDRLAFAFLLNSSVRRDGERVTAEEIRFVAQELEDALGGVYSVQSQEFQMPYVMRLLDLMQHKKHLPPLPKDILMPTIVTGIDALGRGHDLQKYRTMAAVLKEFGIGPEQLAQEFNLSDLITRIGTATMIDMEGLAKSPEQKAAEQQQMQQMQQQASMMDIAGKAAPALIKTMGDQATQANAMPSPDVQGPPQ